MRGTGVLLGEKCDTIIAGIETTGVATTTTITTTTAIATTIAS